MSALRDAIVRGARRTRRRGDGVRSPRAGDGYEFAQLRAYIEGDDPRRIDWAASARGGGLQTRVYLEETSLMLAAIIDTSASMHVGRRHRLSDAADAAVRAWFDAAGSEDRVGRIVDGRIVAGRRAAMHAGATATFDLPAALHFAARVLARGTSLLLVTDAYDLEASRDADVLARVAARCDATVLLTRDPWHDDLPLRGFHRMRDAETGQTRVIYFGARERERFRRAVVAREIALHARFGATGWRVGTLVAEDGRASLERAFGLQ